MNRPEPSPSSRLRLAARVARSAARAGSRLLAERTAAARLPAAYRPQPADTFIAAAHHAGDDGSLYQLEQWLWPFERLAERLREETGIAEPFGILTRSAPHAQRLTERTDLPVRYSRHSSGLDAFMSAPGLRVVYYANQATQNFQALRYPRPAHVHLSHGESEKISMISNQLKAYDRVFTAGPAARARLLGTLIELPAERLVDVGRPQLDAPRATPEDVLACILGGGDHPAADPRPLVFLAPTWEGDSPAMAYGTLPESGEALVEALHAAGMRVLYRPHPRIGRIDPRFARAHERVSALVSAAPGSRVDDSPNVGWQFDAADACIAEMSSVAFDWLATGKPLVMLRPVHPGAEVLAGGLFDRVPAVRPNMPGAAAEVVAALSVELTGGTGREERLAAGRHYLGDTSPGAQQARFEDRSLELLRLRDAQLADS
ncbi:CDP-glycerol glycerophosphotransferase family protein [Brevibacterium pityocampae]|uniref:CDP-glycerol glycerophosphotransferase family protein n=1 Tax=Brevibacterium pityocampae TaxID=506594 RepID=A0ABP8JKI2_9MICO